MSQTFVKRTRLSVSAERAFQWHARPGALERLTPPWSSVQVAERHGGIEDGGWVVLRMPLGPVAARWKAVHFDYVENRQFRDRQTEGPFSLWDHTHLFEPVGSDECDLEDRVEYAPRLGAFGVIAGAPFIRSTLERTFAYRHRITARDLAVHQHYGGRRLHFLVSGSHGLIGKQLCAFLTTGGHKVTRVVRQKPDKGSGAVWWNPTSGQLDTHALDAVDVVVHLAGESIANRWTDAAKHRIHESRGPATQRLSEALLRLQPRPSVLVSASAIGFYGNRAAETLDENSSAGSGFLADVCREWEGATETASKAGIRVVNLRLGVVLTSAGGALAKMLPPFQLGLGGRIGNGEQYMSWIGIDDVLQAILHASVTDSLHGPVNAVAPQPVTNAEFTRNLGKVLRRPTVLPLPAAALRFALGEMADEMLLSSTRVQPTRLEESKFSFWHEDLDSALRHVLGRG